MLGPGSDAGVASLSANRTDSSRGEPVTAGGHLACRFLPDKLEACRPGQAGSLTSQEWRIPFATKSEYSFPICHVDEDCDLIENVCMKTTVNIPDKVLRDAMRHTKAKTKREAIVKALEEMNRRHSQAKLVKYFGKFESLMTNEEIEAMEEDDWKSWTKASKTIRFPSKKK
jgi:hypothetical protein